MSFLADKRPYFHTLTVCCLCVLLATLAMGAGKMNHTDTTMAQSEEPSAPITLFLCGDVMTGRGIDQVLPHPGRPRLH